MVHSLLASSGIAATEEYRVAADFIKGSLADQFAKRKAFAKFVDDLADDMVTFSKRIPREGYAISTVHLGKYNFDLGGFELRFTIPSAKDDQPDKGFLLTINKPYLFKLGMDAAEKLHKSNQQKLYYITKVQSIKARTISEIRAVSSSNQNYYYSRLNKRIEVFYDQGLSQKAFEFNAD